MLVRNALFRRVELAALRRYDELGELDGEAGWNADALGRTRWRRTSTSTTRSAPARTPAARRCCSSRPGRDAWTVRQIFDDPAGDHDWGISAEVDLAASDEAGAAVVRVTAVGPVGA